MCPFLYNKKLLFASSFLFSINFATSTTSEATSSSATDHHMYESERNRLITVIIVFASTLFLVLFMWGFCWFRRRKIKVSRRRAQSYPPKIPMSSEAAFALPNLPSDYALDVVDEPVQAVEGVQLVEVKGMRGVFDKKSSQSLVEKSSSSGTPSSLPSLPSAVPSTKRKLAKPRMENNTSLPSLPTSTSNSVKRFERNMNVRLQRRKISDETTVPTWRAYSESSSNHSNNRYAISEYAESDKHCRPTPGGPPGAAFEPAPSVHSSERASLFGPDDWKRAKEFNRLLNQLTDPKPTPGGPGFGFEPEGPRQTGIDLNTIETESTPDNTIIRALYGK